MNQDIMNMPPVIYKVLKKWGIESDEQINDFFNPKLESLSDPFIMLGMEKAVPRIIKAIEDNEKITVFGDYDADGLTATAMMVLGLRDIGGIVDYYIPERNDENYGFSEIGIETAIKNDSTLVVSDDCGITEVERTKRLREKGIDVIITDHHEPGEDLPQAFAIINPKQNKCPYPFKMLAGAGVAYRLLEAVYSEKGIKEKALDYLDLAAIGTIADIVPLVGENRIIAKLGLQLLPESERAGLRAILSVCSLEDRRISGQDIAFKIAPCLNSAGRMGDVAKAVDLLFSSDESDASTLAYKLNYFNTKRKSKQEQYFNSACEIIGSKYENIDGVSLIAVCNEDWDKGLLGLVAGKLAEIYQKPAIAFTVENGLAVGSGRSIGSFDFLSALHRVSNVILSYGGHKKALGLKVDLNCFDEFENRLNSYCKDNLTVDMLSEDKEAPIELDCKDIDGNLLDCLEYLEPCGEGNRPPLWLLKGVKIVNPIREAGRDTIMFNCTQNSELKFIGFGMVDNKTELEAKEHNDLVVSLGWNYFQGRKSMQAQLVIV